MHAAEFAVLPDMPDLFLVSCQVRLGKFVPKVGSSFDSALLCVVSKTRHAAAMPGEWKVGPWSLRMSPDMFLLTSHIVFVSYCMWKCCVSFISVELTDYTDIWDVVHIAWWLFLYEIFLVSWVLTATTKKNLQGQIRAETLMPCILVFFSCIPRTHCCSDLGLAAVDWERGRNWNQWLRSFSP